jgi:hypothetical protein
MFDLKSFRWCLKPVLVIWSIITLLSFVHSSVSAQAVNAEKRELLYPAGLTNKEVLEGWIGLFDGESAFGWTEGNSKHWGANLSSGELAADGKLSPPMIRTTAQFDDFHLKMEYKVEADANASVFIRTSPNPRAGRKDCYPIKVSDGTLFKEKPKAGVWHRLSVVAVGQQIQLAVDGVKVLDPPPSDLGRGYIGLRADVGKVSFRNIKLKPIVNKNLLADKELSGWSADRSENSKFEVNVNGELQVTGGRGQLESKDQFADFVLSLQCKTNAVGLNSGIFFRCIPGDFMNGYESQIQNVFEDGDRSKPADCGTGGIFRRVNARRVNADDQAWFAKTIIATGPRVGVWVNGFQVTDWVDRRKPDDNPRRGLRLKAGTIAIQGHDPTTDILFREISVRELWPRRLGK